MKSESGWIMPDGQYVWCLYQGHIRCAEEKFGMTEEELEKIAVKVTCMPFSERVMFFGCNPEKHVASFFTLRERMTEEQLATIEKYCLYYRLRPPLEYFQQKEWEESEKLSTAEILAILEK